MIKPIEYLVDLLFPAKCEVCKTLGHDPLCKSCSDRINYLRPTAFSHSVCVYEGVVREAIRRFKFKKRTALARPLGELMSAYLNRHLWAGQMDMIVPVPLHEKRLRERGFNQSELLALQITKASYIPTVAGLLFRTRHTHPQFDLPKHLRLKNIRGAFEIRGKNLVQDKNVLLIDDIYTTGFTVSECTKVLKQSGAKSVHILTLSRAV